MNTSVTKRKALVFIALFGFLFLLNSCSKDDSPEVTGVLKSYFDAELNDSIVGREISFDFEHGFKFVPLRDGKITQLGVRIYEPGIYTVTVYKASESFWDATRTVCAKKDVEQTTYNCWGYEIIEPLDIEKGETYFITVTIPVRVKFNRSCELTFPIKSKDIQIESYVYRFILDDIYVDGNDLVPQCNYLGGYPDFIFK